MKDAILFPGKDAPQAEVEAFLKRMDIPLKAEEYGLDPKKIPGDIPDEVRAGTVKELAEFCRKAGLTKAQGAKVYEQYTNIIKNAAEAGAKRQKELSDTFDERLIKDIGNEKTATEIKEYFKRALIALNDKQFVNELKDSGMLYSTSFVRAIADMWKAGSQEPPIVNAPIGKEAPKQEALPKSDQFNARYGNRRN